MWLAEDNMSFKKHFQKKLFLLIILVFCFVFLGFVKDKTDDVFAQGSSLADLTGWAWSGGGSEPGVGWVSFSCENLGECSTSNYGVQLDSDGNFSGYAWSGVLGWLNFNPGSGFPHQPNHGAQVDLDTGQVTGWAQFVSGEWVLMSGAAFSGVVLDLNTGEFSGRAWGSNKVGWLDFAPSTADSVQIETGDCLCGDWVDGNCGANGCQPNEISRSRTCVPSSGCIESDCNSDPICASCGNGVIESSFGEDCEQNNDCDTAAGETCVNCQCQPSSPSVCGNGVVESGEDCERDSDCTAAGETCINCQCQTPGVCGNGVVELGEDCDDGNSVNDDSCSNNCRRNYYWWETIPYY